MHVSGTEVELCIRVCFFFCYTTFTVLLFFRDSATTGAAIQSPVVISPP